MSSDASDGAEASANREPSPAVGDLDLDETIHQPTRLRIMTLLVSVPESDRLAYGFIQQTLGLTGGNQTIHLRKLEAAGFLAITKEFEGAKPRTWVQATASGRRAYADYLSNLEKALGLHIPK
ncbi:MAG: transcriptional regulator [Acidimicrobiaceae bacterium]|nr:transcriptional regulator [Acidimicrobiaceae bacterium]MYB85856.1 transcriptional regulator [Acidimicrobiaceae bacterium]MYH92471.1 transcriptional regulator [Acidimicrobiaceae bacterium]